MYSDYDAILVTRNEGILTATLNRPETRNAVDEDIDRELLRLIQQVDDDEDVKVVILTGAGTCFSAGGDLGVLQAALDDVSIFERGAKRGKRILQGLLDLDKPVICKLNGPAVGLGATIALFCDMIIASETAKIGDPHCNIGLAAGDGGAIIWPQLIGYARAKQYLYSGELISAPDAAAMGLFNFSVPAARLDATVDEWAQRLARGASRAIAHTKSIVNIPLKQLLASMADAGFGLEMASAQTADHAAAIRAFREKRKPEFTGR